MQKSAEEVLQEVRDALQEQDRFSSIFEPSADGIHESNGIWMIPVKLRKVEPTARRFELYAKFAELETFLQSEKGLNVVLLPEISKMTA